jgi:hypothetical protein
MPFEIYRRGNVFLARGRVEYNGTVITDYFRQSTKASTESGAWAWVKEFEEKECRRYIVGDEEVFTFADAVILYPTKPSDAKSLIPILPEIGHLPVAKITPLMVRNLGPKLYPDVAAATWHRCVIVPVSAVINYSHDLDKCPAIKIKSYSANARIDQDKARAEKGKFGRRKSVPADWTWINAFQEHADPHNAVLVEFMFETGARIGQAIDVKPEDLDILNSRVWLGPSKGHPAQWVYVSSDMNARLSGLTARVPFCRKTKRHVGGPRLFGYASEGGMRRAWRTICEKAGIKVLTPHCFRHGFYTELRVRQGVDPITAAKAGRWKDAALPDRIYAHVEEDERVTRERIRTTRVQRQSKSDVRPSNI